MPGVNISEPIRDRDIEQMRNRIIEYLWREYGMNKTETFHFTDMNRRHVRAYLQDELKLDEAQFSDESTEFKSILSRVYAPLYEYGLIVEYENNNFSLTDRFKDLCQRELRAKEWIDWNTVVQSLRS